MPHHLQYNINQIKREAKYELDPVITAGKIESELLICYNVFSSEIAFIKMKGKGGDIATMMDYCIEGCKAIHNYIVKQTNK